MTNNPDIRAVAYHGFPRPLVGLNAEEFISEDSSWIRFGLFKTFIAVLTTVVPRSFLYLISLLRYIPLGEHSPL